MCRLCDHAQHAETACTQLSNGAAVAGAHVLVKRGGCTFAHKAHNIDEFGGVSMILVDDGPGEYK
jgi:PA domain